jgi:PTS HPr component phosphorylation site.
MKLNIKLSSMEEIKRFATIVTTFYSDINIMKGSIIYDAKSLLAIITMGTNEELEVEIISNDEKEIEMFKKEMEEFR